MIKLNQVCHQRLLPTLPESEDGGNVVLDNNFALLQTGNRSLQVLITRLRGHLSRDPRIRIINVRGTGYKLIVE